MCQRVTSLQTFLFQQNTVQRTGMILTLRPVMTEEPELNLWKLPPLKSLWGSRGRVAAVSPRPSRLACTQAKPQISSPYPCLAMASSALVRTRSASAGSGAPWRCTLSLVYGASCLSARRQSWEHAPAHVRTGPRVERPHRVLPGHVLSKLEPLWMM